MDGRHDPVVRGGEQHRGAVRDQDGEGQVALVVTSASTEAAGPLHGPSTTWTSAPWHWS